MSKLCKYCGAEMDDEAFECPECLKKIPGAEVLAKQKEIEKKQKKKSILIISSIATGGVLLITLLVVAITLIFKEPSDYYEKPIKAYIEGCEMNDYKKFISPFTDYYSKYLSERYAYIILGKIPEEDENVHKAAILYLDSYYQEMTNKYGRDFKITYDVLSEKQYTEEELTKYQDEYIGYYEDGLKGTKFNDGYELAITFKVEGNLGKNTVTDSQFMLFEINGKWYMMNAIDFMAEKDETKDVETYY